MPFGTSAAIKEHEILGFPNRERKPKKLYTRAGCEVLAERCGSMLTYLWDPLDIVVWVVVTSFDTGKE